MFISTVYFYIVSTIFLTRLVKEFRFKSFKNIIIVIHDLEEVSYNYFYQNSSLSWQIYSSYLIVLNRELFEVQSWILFYFHYSYFIIICKIIFFYALRFRTLAYRNLVMNISIWNNYIRITTNNKILNILLYYTRFSLFR